MNKIKWKLMLAGFVVASTFGGIALRSAWATPGSNVSSATIVGPVVMDEIDVKVETNTEGLKIKTKGLWESRAVQYHIVPGGHTGWHSHPGAVFVMIKAGTMTKYEAGDPIPAVYPAGTGFAEHGGDVHIARNEGTSDLEFTAFFLIPLGAAPRIDQPQP